MDVFVIIEKNINIAETIAIFKKGEIKVLFLIALASIVGFIGFLAFTAFFILDAYYDVENFGLSVFGGFVVGIISFIVLGFISIGGARFVTLDETIVVDNTEIISLDRNTAISGEFVLGIGAIGQKDVLYHFYVSIGENEYELKTITTEDGRVVISEGYENPLLIEYESRSSNWFLHGFFQSTETSYRIKLPYGSIDRTMQP